MNSEYYPLQKLMLFSDKDGYKNVTDTVEKLKIQNQRFCTDRKRCK